VSELALDPWLQRRLIERGQAQIRDAIGEAVERGLSGLADGISERLGAIVADRLLAAEQGGDSIVDPIAGRFGRQVLIPAVAAPGQDATYVVPGGVALYPLSVFARLACSAVVGERSLSLEYRTASDARYLVAGANVTQAASQTQSYCWQPEAGVGSWPVDDVATAPLPQQLLYPGRKLVLHLASGDAADQLDQVLISATLYDNAPEQ
jgi:hypothetical protein